MSHAVFSSGPCVLIMLNLLFVIVNFAPWSMFQLVCNRLGMLGHDGLCYCNNNNCDNMDNTNKKYN